jgi:hypothetical protein
MNVPEGWKLVPAEPTREMLAEIDLIDGFTHQALTTRYKAMLAACPAAPSVEQGERGAEWAPYRIWLQRGMGDEGSHTWCTESIDDCDQVEYMRVSRESCPTCHGNDLDLPCAFPEGRKPGCARDVRLARAASTSANVAQGAKLAVWYVAPPPAQPDQALTVTPAMVKAAMPWLTNLHHMRKTDKESHVEEAIKAALTVLRSTSTP